MRHRVASVLLCCGILSIAQSNDGGEPSIQFVEVSATAGMGYAGPSYSASWGDLDADGSPDLWVGNHQNFPSLYLNNGDGTFTNIADSLAIGPRKDAHGVAWADFDNDGTQDLIELVGGLRGFLPDPLPQFANNLYVNDGGVLRESASEHGLDFPLARGRTPLWVDFDSDGYLDVLLVNARGEQVASAVFRQIGGEFFDVSEETGLDLRGSPDFCSLSDLTGDDTLDLVCQYIWFPSGVYDLTQMPFVEVSDSLGLPTVPDVTDMAIADFDGDLRPDVFLVRFPAFRSEFSVVTANEIRAYLRNKRRSEAGLGFAANGEIEIQVGPEWLFGVQQERIFLGASGRNPDEIPFALSAENPDNWGIASHVPGQDVGLYVGFLPEPGEWLLLLSTNDPEVQEQASVVITARGRVSDVRAIGFDQDQSVVQSKLLGNGPAGFTEHALGAAGLATAWGMSVVAGDFDNDMDQDLYIVRTQRVANLPNLLLENRDTGFQEVPNAGGAAGTADGRGDSVAVADYDGDGFLDIFVTNGQGLAPFNDGPDQLFRNLGNSNHWLEIELEGVESSRDGIGARVVAKTPDGISQLREQHGGIHRKAQNHQRIHFGLGENLWVDSLIIHWPSGVRQRIGRIPADRVITARENGLTCPSPRPAKPTSAPRVLSSICSAPIGRHRQ